MATKRELNREVRAVTNPARMEPRAALAFSNPTEALLLLSENCSDQTDTGKALRRDVYATHVLFSEGVAGLFLTSLYEELPQIRVSFLAVGAQRTVAALDEVQRDWIDPMPGAKEDPSLALFTDEFEDWRRTSPPSDELSDKARDCLLAYFRSHPEAVEALGAREPELPPDPEAIARQAEVDALANEAVRAHQRADERLFHEMLAVMVQNGRRLAAIRAWRDRYKCGLSEASEAVRRLIWHE